jgi:hypothetical protein
VAGDNPIDIVTVVDFRSKVVAFFALFWLQLRARCVQYVCWPGFAPLFPVGDGPNGAIRSALIFLLLK